jgi:UDP:flavonoid glycosyltransferase YjiC (YdhE family)
MLIPNSVVMVKGKVEEREDRLSLIVDSISPVTEQADTAESSDAKPVDPNTIIIPQGTSKATLFELNKLLQENRGDDQVTLIFQNGHSNRELKLPFGINLTTKLRNIISQLIEAKAIG